MQIIKQLFKCLSLNLVSLPKIARKLQGCRRLLLFYCNLRNTLMGFFTLPIAFNFETNCKLMIIVWHNIDVNHI